MSALSQSLADGLEQGAAAFEWEGQAAWLPGLRERGRARFRSLGLPGRTVERWKYTSLQELEQRALGLPGVEAQATSGDAPDALCQADVRLSMSDGRWQSVEGVWPEGVTLQPLEQALSSGGSGLQDVLGSLDIEDRAAGFAALNTAALRHGWFLRVAPGIDAGRLLVQWAASEAGAAWLSNARVCVLLEAGARLQWVEQFESAGTVGSQLNLVSQVRLEAGASLDHVRLQQENPQGILISSSDISQESGSEYRYTGVDLGGRLVRHDVRARLLGSAARCQLNGACLTRGRTHVDNHLDAEHLAGDCTSGQYFRAVLGDRSRVVFNGRVYVARGADGTEARQSSAGLLLSPQAEIDSKPELEIYADEVVASHGATVGQLDPNQLFYLQSRGLSPDTARGMLTTAFCRSVIDPLRGDDLREALQARLQSCLSAAGVG